MILGMDHTSFTVSDLDRSIDFYSRCFGFKVARRSDSGSPSTSVIVGYEGVRLKIAHIVLGPADVELIEYIHPKGEHRPILETKDVGTPHLCFATDDIQAEYERLRGLGVRFKSVPQVNPKGTGAVYGLDPDGITFELVQRVPKGG